jgi:hypothetical protein
MRPNNAIPSATHEKLPMEVDGASTTSTIGKVQIRPQSDYLGQGEKQGNDRNKDKNSFKRDNLHIQINMHTQVTYLQAPEAGQPDWVHGPGRVEQGLTGLPVELP